MITVIGAGLAGCEAAWAIARAGIPVTLREMKPVRFSPAHKSADFAELVCSNSLKAARLESAAGMLKEEMRRLGSVCMEAAAACAVPAGGALAVEREQFSRLVTERIRSHPLITVETGEVAALPETGTVVVATGPLTSDALAAELARRCGAGLHFYDAAAPIVAADSLDMARVFRASRYGREESGEGDYLNCPLSKEEYEAFHTALITAETAPLHNFEKDPSVYEGCMPIEVLAKRGSDAIRYGPMKPVGLRDPNTGHRPWAVLQLRAENREGTMVNLVGFQTNLKFPEQRRVFGMIPALAHAEFLRYGVMHRNTFLNSPALLTAGYQLRGEGRLFFAGQLTGVEGYMESAASGILAGINAARFERGLAPLILPPDTMTGALAGYISDPANEKHFQPMGANFGVLPPLADPIRDKRERYAALSARGLSHLDRIMEEENV